MAYRYGQRHQAVFFPPSIDDYVGPEAPVRAYDAIIEALDLAAMGFVLDPHQVGCPQYDPPTMLKLLVYGYSYGVRSSRKLERECHYNVSFIWLTGGLKPDHKTIAEFRRKNKKALQQVLKQCARLCVKLELIEGNTLFVDGTKIRANASAKHTWDAKRCQKQLDKIDRRIAEILAECDAVDEQEQDQPSWVELQADLHDQEALKAKVKSILDDLQRQGDSSTNTTDPDCKIMRSIQGSHAAYNVQSVVDQKHGLIAHSDVVNENTDHHQFADQIDQAQDNLGKTCQTACGDAGYSDVDELEKIDQQDITVVVPSQQQAAKEEKHDPFDKSQFHYDAARDCYVCPQGHTLRYSYTNQAKAAKVYRGGSACQQCIHFGVCTQQPRGRGINRLLKADLQEKLATQYETPAAQAVYAQRKEKVELPFGHIKHNLGVTGFLLRGLAGVKAEAAILAGCFNMVRMINLLGVSGLLARLGN